MCVIGREPEQAVLEEFLDWGSPALALVIAGGQGVGKTVLWEEGLRRARERDTRVLAARASGAEAEMSFAGLFDLLATSMSVPSTGFPGRNGARWKRRCSGRAGRADRAVRGRGRVPERAVVAGG